MKVRDLMHKGIELASPDTPVATLAKTMREKDVGAIPIGSNGQLLGMVTDRDITVRAVANGKDIARLTAKDVMTKGVICCNDSDSVKNALHTMEAKQIRRLPVVDENSKLVGMLSLGDISQAMPDRFAGEVMRAVSAHHA
jgi:CBS domain-containing protein